MKNKMEILIMARVALYIVRKVFLKRVDIKSDIPRTEASQFYQR